MKKLNVIIILIDGGRLDRIMNSNYFQSLKSKFSFFSNLITYSPHTIAAMHAIFSGCYGTRTGTNSYWSTYQFKKNRFKTLTEYLHDLDYYTYADLHSEIVIPKQGFDKFVTYDEDKDDIMSRHSDLIENFSKKDKNFFLYLHYSKIHTGIRDSVLKVYTNFSEEYFKNKKLNDQRYDKLFNESEIYLKNILDKIYSMNLHQNSLILIMSDHGISVGEKMGEIAYGAFCYDYTLRTFAFINWPKIKPTEIHQQVRSVDFMPTILDTLGIRTESEFERLDGESLVPLIIGKKMKEKIAYSETGNPFNQGKPPKEPNTMSVRTSKWKLIHNKHNNTEELYDLENDPNETLNLAGTNLDVEDVLREELFSLSG
jgi:arylsulfatase A-like enzyme|tara:strand:+ start:428 stop:1537 length:1110 start_codon:yes stop_codon:yes gene_type:complete